MIEQIVYDISQRYEAISELKKEVNDRIGYCDDFCKNNDISSNGIYMDNGELKKQIYNGSIIDSWQFAMQQSQELLSYVAEYQTLRKLENLYLKFNSGEEELNRDIGVEHQEIISNNNEILLSSYEIIDPSHMNRSKYESIFNRLQGVSSLIEADDNFALRRISKAIDRMGKSSANDSSDSSNLPIDSALGLDCLKHYQDRIDCLQNDYEAELGMFKDFKSSRRDKIRFLNNENSQFVLMLFFGYFGWIFSPRGFVNTILGLVVAIVVQGSFSFIISAILKNSIKTRFKKAQQVEDSTNKLQSSLRNERRKDAKVLLEHYKLIREFKKSLKESKGFVQFIKV